MKEENKNQQNPEEEQVQEKSYKIQRITRFYKDIPIQPGDKLERGCAIDSDLFSKTQKTTREFRQAEDIILLKLTEEELVGKIDQLKKKHLVDWAELEELADADGMIEVKKMKEIGVTALFTDHTRIGKIDFMDAEHVASEIRQIDDYCYRHDSTLEEDGIIDSSEPVAWKLTGINVNLEKAYWESKEVYTH